MSAESPSTASAIRVRPGTRADVPLIYKLIQELAEYEKLSLEVTGSEEHLEDALFGPRPHAEVMIGLVDDEPAGFALFFHNFSTFLARPGMYLEDLFVRPAHRGKGLGRALLLRVAKLAQERNCGRFEWSVLDWNQSAIDFYKSVGAVPMNDWTIFRLTGEALKRL